MAWNSLTDIVELTTQQRMKDDPEYTAAVLRLRKRRCTVADAMLFNSRLVKSSNNPAGVDLSSDEAIKGVAIVPTNNQRKAVNFLKARANCTDTSGIKLVMCEALDTLSDSKSIVPNDIPSCSRDGLLKVDMT